MNDNTFLTPKHHPHSLSTTYETYRSVLAGDLPDKLEDFIEKGDYSLTQYDNRGNPATPLYIVIKPNSGSSYSIPASGVQAGDLECSIALDRLVVVSGNNQGWHVFGENQSSIDANSNLKLVREIT